jgi:hypothetical protein
MVGITITVIDTIEKYFQPLLLKLTDRGKQETHENSKGVGWRINRIKTIYLTLGL